MLACREGVIINNYHRLLTDIFVKDPFSFPFFRERLEFLPCLAVVLITGYCIFRIIQFYRLFY